MARYIDADKADVERIYCSYSDHCTLEDVEEWLDEQPTADVKEVKHGHWIDKKVKHSTSSGGTGTTPYRECSVCGWDYPVITVGQHFKPYKHCPECTARMDGDNNPQ